MTTSTDVVRVSAQVTVIQCVGTDRSEQTHTVGRRLLASNAEQLRVALMDSFLNAKRAATPMAFDRPLSDQIAKITAKFAIKTGDSEKSFFAEREMLSDTADEVACNFLEIFHTTFVHPGTSSPGADGDDNENGDDDDASLLETLPIFNNFADPATYSPGANSDENKNSEEEEDDDVSLFEMLPSSLTATMRRGLSGSPTAIHATEAVAES